ncbi:CH-like domain-containing protein [Giardia duodenalis]|uniref:CH-like domain-containing protein n=1 Tax=Giardia intestinalis (strain ATCC 50803 / WB clone C6) TaxID=184922 RepID=A8BVJ3_GIAIC|nr:CH-like domain-containing protein [Giardia intestinalis]KAE8304504.1 CH-like domain-containing protein [Giardia intestinalis]|eukprot:XP_001704567.1 Hypothetical protein GL50803_24043 [Giardia lamblia ATCC 50803]
MKLPYQLISWCLRQGIATQLRSPRQDLHNGYLIAELLSKLYPEHFKIVQFDNQSSATVTSKNWNRIAAVAPKIKLSLTDTELEACKAGDEQALVSILKRVHTLHTGKDLAESKQSTRPVSTNEDRSLTKGPVSKLGVALNANHQNQTITQDPLKFLVTRNLDNIHHTSAHEQTTFATATNLSTILVHGDADGLNAASSRPNNSMLSMRPSTAAVDNDDMAFRMNPGATGTSNENKLPKNVPKFVRGVYISTRRLLMELSTACKNAITSLPELQNMLEMIDPRVDTIYPFINICLRVPSENAVELFDALILELKPFTTLLVDQISANPFLFWELLKLLVLSSINLRRVTGPKAEFPRQATEYLLHLIAELGRSSPSSLALIFSHIIKTRLMHVIDLREFGLHNFVDLYMAFLPIMEHESALDIITNIIQLADNNFREKSDGQYMINPSKLRLAVLTSIVSVISGYFIKFSHDPRFMLYGMFVLPLKQHIGESKDDRSKSSSPVRFSERDNMHASTGTAQSCSEYSVSTGYGVMVQGDNEEEMLSGRELLEQMLLDILYVIIRVLVGSENLLIDERVIVLDLLFRCCAANPQELMPHAEPTILVIFESIVNRTKPCITLVSDSDDVEGNTRSSHQPYRVANVAPNYGSTKLTSLCAGTDLQTIPEEGSKKTSLSGGNPATKTPRRASIASLSVPETHAIVDGLHSSTHTASLGPSVSVGASQISIVPSDRHSPIAVMNTVASERSATETSPEHSVEGMVKVETHGINCQYDNIPYLHYEMLLSLVLILRRYASLCIKDHYDTPLVLVSYDLERAIMDFHERLSPVSLLIGILSSTGRNMDMMKHITPFTIQTILDDPEKAEAYNETLHVLRCIMNVLIQSPDMTEIVFAALDGKGDFEQSIVSYPPHCYLKIVQALYPGSELMEIVPALLCVAVTYSKEFLANKSIDPNNYFIAIARLIEFIPDISCFVYDHLSDELFTQITDPRVSETASSLLTDLLIELDSMVDEQELQASIHALIQYAFNSNEVLLPTARKAFSGKFMEECQQSVIAFLNSLTMVPTALSLMKDILIKTDSEDYGNVHLAKFIRSILEESSVGED